MPDNDKSLEDQMVRVLSSGHIWEEFFCFCDRDEYDREWSGYPSFKCLHCGSIFHKENESDEVPPERACAFPCPKTIKR